MSGPKLEVLKDLTQNELRELRRVFDMLAGFAAKQRLRRALAPAQDRRAKILAFKRSPETVRVVDENGVDVPVPVMEAELGRLEVEIATLQRRVDDVDAVPEAERKIQARDLQAALATLGKTADKVRGC